MSYYFCIVGTRDNPLYEADLASKPSDRSGPASFFSSSSSASTSAASRTASGTGPGASGGASGRRSGENSTSGGVFGFGNALGALTGGFASARDSVRSASTASQSAAAGGTQTEGKGLGFGRYNDKQVLQMIAHSSLDVVEDVQFTNGSMYLKAIDRINEWTTSAFLLPGNIKFLILHEHKHDDGIRNFFIEVWESWVKLSMNPFHDPNSPIRSPAFDTRVRASARKHL